MSLVAIDQEKCNECGICVSRCAMNFRTNGQGITTHAEAETCSLCGHCVALCPTDAIVHEKMDMDSFFTLDRKLKFGRDEFAEFVRSRRSHRAYKDEKIPRADLEHLVQMARFCPTGGNAQPVQILIIEDEARLDKLSKLTQAAIQDLYPGAREKREKAGIEEREDPIFHKAPALMVFHIPKGRGSARTDSVIAAQTVVLAAMTIGLGTCYIGLLEHAWHTDETTREVLDLPEGHTLGSAIVLGYPALTFLRAVDRRPMDVRWE